MSTIARSKKSGKRSGHGQAATTTPRTTGWGEEEWRDLLKSSSWRSQSCHPPPPCILLPHRCYQSFNLDVHNEHENKNVINRLFCRDRTRMDKSSFVKVLFYEIRESADDNEFNLVMGLGKRATSTQEWVEKTHPLCYQWKRTRKYASTAVCISQRIAKATNRSSGHPRDW